jgi:hypothetical protein
METALELANTILTGEELPCRRVTTDRWMVVVRPGVITSYQRAQLKAAGFKVREDSSGSERTIHIMDMSVYRGLWG